MNQRQIQWMNIKQTLKAQAIVLGGFIAFIWLLEILDRFIFGGALDNFGIRPRTAVGLWGILLAPFLHIGFSHVAANTVPFLVLGWFVLAQRRAVFLLVTGITIVISGLGVWLFAPSNSVHVGASGLIFGYFGYLLARGYFERSFKAVSLSILVLLLYGGMIWGVLPLRYGISWQGHLFGFIGGGLAAYRLSPRRDGKTEPTLESEITLLDVE